MDWRIAYDPLAALGKGRRLPGAIVVTMALTVAAWWGGLSMDGALNLQIAPKTPSVGLVVVESLVAWLSLGLWLFASARLFGARGSWGAHLTSAGLSRFPYVLAAVILSRPVLGGKMLTMAKADMTGYTPNPEALVTPGMFVGGLAVFLLILWSVVLLYTGYKRISRTDGVRAVVTFLIGVGTAQVVSMMLLSILT